MRGGVWYRYPARRVEMPRSPLLAHHHKRLGLQYFQGRGRGRVQSKRSALQEDGDDLDDPDLLLMGDDLMMVPPPTKKSSFGPCIMTPEPEVQQKDTFGSPLGEAVAEWAIPSTWRADSGRACKEFISEVILFGGHLNGQIHFLADFRPETDISRQLNRIEISWL
ncbi:hypothetical protein GWK47_023657 [Chionoecetes opilio]|uniref:Uncharacterized protein n=1 Tax=Chionoecetes opilio TaxID=41210 RepID=A0A8J4XM53_CHIOP|nr:hypothetical protein GWK47_023657 [Chionoecetes opilio]